MQLEEATILQMLIEVPEGHLSFVCPLFQRVLLIRVGMWVGNTLAGSKQKRCDNPPQWHQKLQCTKNHCLAQLFRTDTEAALIHLLPHAVAAEGGGGGGFWKLGVGGSKVFWFWEHFLNPRRTKPELKSNA